MQLMFIFFCSTMLASLGMMMNYEGKSVDMGTVSGHVNIETIGFKLLAPAVMSLIGDKICIGMRICSHEDYCRDTYICHDKEDESRYTEYHDEAEP